MQGEVLFTMGLEIYQTRWQVNYRGRATTQRFHWLADNTADLHPLVLSTEIEDNIFLDTDWAFWLLSMQSQSSFLRLLQTWRVSPAWGPSTKHRWAADEFPGRYLSDVGQNFLTANLKWSYVNDFNGKAQTRVGPLGEGAIQPNDWYFVFKLAALAFIERHVTPRTTSSGINFRACHVDRLGIASMLTTGELAPVPGRQENRRWKP